jgi:hypothetical protein
VLLASFPAAAQSRQTAPAASPAQAPIYQQFYADDVRNTYFTAYLLRNFGGELFDAADESYDVNGSRGFGMSLTFWARGGASAELDYSYSPDFLGLDETFDIDNKLHTITFSGVFGPWIHMGNHVLRPYGVAGGGLMRSRFTDFAILDADTRNQGIITFGGGVLFLASRRVGVRGDVRYNLGFGDRVGDEGWGFLDDFNYLKGSIGLSIAW